MDKQPKGIKGLSLRNSKFDQQNHSLPKVRLERDRYRAESVKNEMLATVDELTGLLNYRGYGRQLDEKIAKQRRDNYHLDDNAGGLGIFFFDSIGFKLINDRLGKPAGDKTLQVISHHLKENSREGEDIVARPGGDEFIVVESLHRMLDFQKRLDPESSKSILSKVNEGILSDLRTELGGEYVKSCDTAGKLRVDGFYISSEDLEKSGDELSEFITGKMIEVSKKLDKDKRKSSSVLG